MNRLLLTRLFLIVFILVACIAFSPYLHAQVTIAQISDSHIGLARAPEGANNLRKAVQMINERHPDVVVVSGDIGERPSAWDEARDILKGLHAKVYYIPGNHDVHSNDVDRYRDVFGRDYYKFQVKYVTVYMLDSQLWGNWDNFNAHTEPSMPPETKAEGEKEINWLESQAGGQAQNEEHGKNKGKDHDKNSDNRGAKNGEVAIAVQHVPAERDHGFPDDPKPYWVVNQPWRSREEDALKKLGVHDVLAGHWHIGKVFNAGGLTWHVAPATSWSPFGGKLGFAMNTVMPDGKVKTEYVYLDGTTETP
ncbi:MAG: metallophosphoesterase [Terriglobia bacterium]|nr:metallophosphoesterase [Terriglobia bacterium]